MSQSTHIEWSILREGTNMWPIGIGMIVSQSTHIEWSILLDPKSVPALYENKCLSLLTLNGLSYLMENIPQDT